MNDKARISLACATGVLLSIARYSFDKNLHPRSIFEPNPPSGGIFTIANSINQLINSPFVLLPWFAVMVFLAISKRDAPKSWVYAFLAGVALPDIIFHIVLHWM